MFLILVHFMTEASGKRKRAQKSEEKPSKKKASHSSKKALRIDNYESSCKSPTEDRKFMLRGDGYDVISVLDGHGGYQVAEMAAKFLPNAIESRLLKLEDIDRACKQKSDVIPNLMKEAFLETDAHIRSACVEDHKYCDMGACVIVVLITKKVIWVANAGDSGALLISEGNRTKWLNEFHNAGSSNECNRLRAEFPDEEDIVDFIPKLSSTSIAYEPYQRGRVGYLKGVIQPTRSFGDFFLKDKDLAYAKPYNEFYQLALRNFHPPYLTAEPDVQSYKRDDEILFLVLGTDGLWDDWRPESVLSSIHTSSSNLAACLKKERYNVRDNPFDDIACYVVQFK